MIVFEEGDVDDRGSGCVERGLALGRRRGSDARFKALGTAMVGNRDGAVGLAMGCAGCCPKLFGGSIHSKAQGPGHPGDEKNGRSCRYHISTGVT